MVMVIKIFAVYQLSIMYVIAVHLDYDALISAGIILSKFAFYH